MTRSTLSILVALVLGIATGLFLGEWAAVFEYVADAYVRLLQMTVLPYMVVSVIAGFGGLAASHAKQLFLRVGLLTLVLWGLSLVLAFVMPLAFPTIETAFFFSSTLVEERPPLDFVSIYIPTNAFQSLANSVVPAVVLFSGFLGIALIGIEKKEPLLSGLVVMGKVLSRANQFALRLTPIGLFAIAANTVGTIGLDQIAHLKVFLISYGAMSLLLVFWILPGLISCLTPIPASRVLQATRDSLITAFMTGELFIVLPALVEKSKELLAEYGSPTPEEGDPADVIVPTFYNFPHVAKLLSLSFILFAAWYSDTDLNLFTKAQLALAGVVSMFGSMNMAIPFLLDFARIPSDTFQLFLATGIVNSRFGTLASAMHMVVLGIVGTYAMTRTLRFSPVRIGRYALISVFAIAVTVAGTGYVLRMTGEGTYDKNRIVMEMQFRRPPSVQAVVMTALPDDPSPSFAVGASVLDGVRERGRLRVGYFEGQMPYSFVNARGELVGFDVEMAHELADELEVGLDFVPVTRENLADTLSRGQCDVVMAGLTATPLRLSRMEFSQPYMDETLAFVVPDHRRADFSSAAWVRATPGLRIGVPKLPYLEGLVQREFPNVTIVPMALSSETLSDYLEGRGEPVDAVMLTAERGSFATLLHPDFSVAIPHPVVLKVPLSYAVAKHDISFARFMTLWVDIKKKDGTIDGLYGHWILGKDARPPKPHWSVIRNVFHWVE